MKDKKTPVTPEAVGTEIAEQAKAPSARTLHIKLLTAVIAIFLAFCIVSGFLIADIANANKTETDPTKTTIIPFNYTVLDIKDYFSAFSKDTVTGLTVPGKEYAVEEIDEEWVTNYINYLFRETAAVTESGKRTAVVDYADQVYIYIVDTRMDGEPLGVDYFINAYLSASSVVIGDETFGEEFDAALTGKKPVDTFYTHKTNAEITADSVITLTYNATIKGENKVIESYSGLRIDLATAKDYLKTPLLAANPMVGQKFTFTASHDIDDDGTVDEVEYEACVNSVLEETPLVFDATLPEDFFADTMGEEYTALNGKKITFSVIMEYVNKRDAVKLADATVANIKTLSSDVQMGFTAKKETDAEVRQELIDFVTKAMKESRESSLKENSVSLIWNAILDKMTFDVPEEAFEKSHATILGQLQAEYLNYYTAYETIDDFAIDYFGYDTKEYQSYNDFIDEQALRSARREMLVYGIYEYCNVKIDEDTFHSEYEEAMSYYREALGDVSKKEVDDYFISIYGVGLEVLVRDTYVRTAVDDFLFENNTIDFETSAENKDN